MIRIRKNKTTRKKLTGPSEEEKPVTEKGVQMVSESRGQPRDLYKGQSRDQPRDQYKGQSRDQPRDQYKGQSRDQARGISIKVSPEISREISSEEEIRVKKGGSLIQRKLPGRNRYA